jgi:hypothetical protein
MGVGEVEGSKAHIVLMSNNMRVVALVDRPAQRLST